MPKPSRMLANDIADAVVAKAAEKPLLGKPFIRLGPLFMRVGATVFEAGGCLGYALRENKPLLGKLLGVDPDRAGTYIAGLERSAHGRSDYAAAGEQTLLEAYVRWELALMGILDSDGIDEKELGRKCDEQFAQLVTVMAFNNGAGFGFYFPEEFGECWTRTWDEELNSPEWAEAKEEGWGTLEWGISTAAVGVYRWAQSYALGYITDDELAIITKLLESSGHFKVTD